MKRRGWLVPPPLRKRLTGSWPIRSLRYSVATALVQQGSHLIVTASFMAYAYPHDYHEHGDAGYGPSLETLFSLAFRIGAALNLAFIVAENIGG